MYGYNIQSNFFEDTLGKVWFTTYEALNYYNPVTDDLNYFFMISANGDTLKSNYKAFHLEGNDLFLKAGLEVFVFDIHLHKIKYSYPFDFHDYFELALIASGDRKLIFAGDHNGYIVYSVGTNGEYKLICAGMDDISAVFNQKDGRLFLGHSNGMLSLFDPFTGNFIYRLQASTTPINGIATLSGNRLLFSASSNKLYVFDVLSQTIIQHIKPIHAITNEPFKVLFLPYIDIDSTLWISGDNQGLFYFNLKKRKFRHFFGNDPQYGPVSVTRIISVENEKYILLTRTNGILLTGINGETLHHWHQLPNGKTDFTSLSGFASSPGEIFFCSYDQFYHMDIRDKSITTFTNETPIPNLKYRQVEQLSNGKIIASCLQHLLMEIIPNKDSYSLKPYGQLKEHSALTTYFKEDQKGNLYISNDEVNLLVLTPAANGSDHNFSYALPIAGGIRGLADAPGHNAVYIGNSHGLFYINRMDRTFYQIVDKEKLLLQTIYSILTDEQGDLWLGTNKGLLRYTPATSQVKVFSPFDGVQASEYNTHACLKEPDGGMFFGGVNGLNYFHPGSIRLSEQEAPVHFSELMINDAPDSFYRVPGFHKMITLPYARNTISFEFHAIDYADPDATRVKYKLSGVDDDYIESKEPKAFARYANLRHGQYTLSVIGANSDGIWNPSPSEINIIVHPPFWLTWWFILLGILLAASLIYWMIRSYYQRKLEKKNQLLREQSLIIERQKAIEHERTRIASEMHDDLGAGLTTIRYLSDKALLQAKDEGEANQIKRIAEHSNVLVRNMSEIIWAMNARFDNAENLIGYLRRYASEFLEEHQMPLNFTAKGENLDHISMGGEKRRNVFLVFKELLHNTIKYSGASRVGITVEIGSNLTLQISEFGGRGFDPNIAVEKGNGIYNSLKRIQTVGGTIIFNQDHEAMHIRLEIPLDQQRLE